MEVDVIFPQELAKFQERRLDVGCDDEHLCVWA
jgi:hypothetical protein